MQGTIPWAEKYRPNDLKNMMLNDHLRTQIDVSLNKLSHLLFAGASGIGKTTAARCIARDILGDDVKNNFIELNSAEERGMKSIGDIVTPFCKRKTNNDKIKIVMMDEADGLTIKYQNDIVYLIKQFGDKCKFFFICNDSTCIIQDIQSVCSIVRFNVIEKDQIIHFLSEICAKEDKEYDAKGLLLIYNMSNGDLRAAINFLQLTAFSEGRIRYQDVIKACKYPSMDEIQNIIDLVFEFKFPEANTELFKLIDEGYHDNDIILTINNLLDQSELLEDKKLKLTDVVNKASINLAKGTARGLLLSNMLANMIKIMQ